MSRIKIKNFGPIKEGYQEGEGWMDIKKVTVFIGNQGSGKSTVAKVISTLTWIEKALNRGDIETPKSFIEFHNYFNYQGIKDYFTQHTIIEYWGNAYNIVYRLNSGKPTLDIKKSNSDKYIVPKISYIPAERNLLSVINNASGVKGLPECLFDFTEELKIGQNEMLNNEIELPINDAYYRYDKESRQSFIRGKDYNLNLLFASSGFQSLVPLFLVSNKLAKKINENLELNSSNINVTQRIRINEEIAMIMFIQGLSDSERINKANEIQARFLNKCLVSIVEEPEQNLYPTSQRSMLNSLLELNNLNDGNKLIMTTHSPYLINYLTHAVKANSILKKINSSNQSNELIESLDKIVPINATVAKDDWVVYELNELDGTIIKLKDYKGLPSDNNYLNEKMGEGNQIFANLLDIEDLCQ